MKETLKNCFTGFVAIAALLTLIVACHKDPTPSPTPTPDPQTPDTTQVDTTVYPDTVYLDWDWEWRTPPKDSIEFFASKNSIKKIIMILRDFNSTGFEPKFFNDWRIYLEECVNVSKGKGRGAGTIYVAPFNGAQMPDPNETNLSGMAAVDSAWYVQNGWQIQRGKPDK